jgi:hydroxyethylthiazole kinase-like uncharacterized protein yjeF
MLPVLDNEAMREADRHTIDDLGVPGLELMENAATGVVDALRDSFPEARRILILCGRGNNGGDGLAAARLLADGGLEIKVLLFAKPDTLSPDAKPSSNPTPQISSWTPSSAPASTGRSAAEWPRSWSASTELIRGWWRSTCPPGSAVHRPVSRGR